MRSHLTGKLRTSLECARLVRRGPRAALVALSLAVSGLASGVAAESDPLRCRVRLLGGREVEGRLAAVTAERLRVEGEPRAFAYHEIRAVHFASSLRSTAGARNDLRSPRAADGADGLPDRPDARAFVAFTSGEILPAKVVGTDAQRLEVIVRGERTDAVPYGETIGRLKVPLAVLRGFRLREPYKFDDAFEDSLSGPPPTADTVFVRQRERLVRVEGVFQTIDEEHVQIDFRGQSRRIKRSRLQGVQYAPLAGRQPAAGYEGRVHLAGGGALPAMLVGLRAEPGGAPFLELSVGGARWEAPLAEVRAMTFASDRIQFLSDLEPSRVEQTTFFGGEFPYRRDLAVSGEPLRLAGETYAKGLGTHPRSILEYSLDGNFATFVARVGIQEGGAEPGAADVRVLADERELFGGTVRGGEAPLEVSLSLDGARTLRLETDFGPDGVGFGDHVNWIEARVVKPSAPSSAGARGEGAATGVDDGDEKPGESGPPQVEAEPEGS